MTLIDTLRPEHWSCQAYQPVAKVAAAVWPQRGRVSCTERHGDGQETGGATGNAVVGDGVWQQQVGGCKAEPGHVRCLNVPEFYSEGEPQG